MAKKYISKYTGPEIDSGLDNIPKLEGKLTELESEVGIIESFAYPTDYFFHVTSTIKSMPTDGNTLVVMAKVKLENGKRYVVKLRTDTTYLADADTTIKVMTQDSLSSIFQIAQLSGVLVSDNTFAFRWDGATGNDYRIGLYGATLVENVSPIEMIFKEDFVPVSNYGTIVPSAYSYIDLTLSQVTIPRGSRMIVGGNYIEISENVTLAKGEGDQSGIVLYNIHSRQFRYSPTSTYDYTIGDYILFSVGYEDRYCSLPFSYYTINGEKAIKDEVYTRLAFISATENAKIDITDNTIFIPGFLRVIYGNGNIYRIPSSGIILQRVAGSGSGVQSEYVIFDPTNKTITNIAEQEISVSALEEKYVLFSVANGLVGCSLPFDYYTINGKQIFDSYTRMAFIASTQDAKINITDNEIFIPSYLRIIYGDGNIYRIPIGGITLQRAAPTGSEVQSEYVLFDAANKMITTIAEQEISTESLGDKYVLFNVSRGLSGCSLNFTEYTINGKSAISLKDVNDVVFQNKHKESALINTLLYKGNSSVKDNDKLSILHLTDIHEDTENISRIVEYYQKYEQYLDFAIHTGDSVANVITDANPFEQVIGAEKILNVAGNHEAWLSTSDTDYLATEKEVYDKIFANNIANWGVVQPQDAISLGKCYYYKDIRNYRLIVLDSIHWHTGGNQQITDDARMQRAWFEGVLADAISGNKIVICALHYPPVNGIDVIRNLGGFNSYHAEQAQDPVLIGDGWYAQDEIFTCVDNFINVGGKFACWIAGHTHIDYFGKVHGHGNQVFVVLGSSGNGASADGANVRGTNTQDNFNIMTISHIEEKILIKIMRVGNDFDVYNRSKNALCYNVTDSTIISIK